MNNVVNQLFLNKSVECIFWTAPEDKISPEQWLKKLTNSIFNDKLLHPDTSTFKIDYKLNSVNCEIRLDPRNGRKWGNEDKLHLTVFFEKRNVNTKNKGEYKIKSLYTKELNTSINEVLVKRVLKALATKIDSSGNLNSKSKWECENISITFSDSLKVYKKEIEVSQTGNIHPKSGINSESLTIDLTVNYPNKDKSEFGIDPDSYLYNDVNWLSTNETLFRSRKLVDTSMKSLKPNSKLSISIKIIRIK